MLQLIMLFGILLFTLGLIFGSFITAFTWRYPRGISIAKGRSMCPVCRHKISWYDNIPLLSFIILGGRCRSCKKPISVRYPLIELSVGFGFIFIFFNFYPDYLTMIYYLITYCILVCIFVIDLENQVIPDFFVFLGIAIWFLYSIITGSQAIFSNLLAGFVCSIFLLIIYLVTRGRGMGLGDVKFALLGGVTAGLGLAVPWLLLAFLTGGLTGSILILVRKAKLKSKIAFGPFLVLALLIVLLWSEKINTILGLLL